MSNVPQIIASSCYREDLAEKREAEGRGANWLYPPKKPSGGQEVLFQVEFSSPMKVARTGENTEWCMMAGRVRLVLGSDRFVARVDASPRQAPKELTGTWDAGFVWDDAEKTWALESLSPRPLKSTSAKLPSFVREGYNRDDACRENEASSKSNQPWFYEGRKPEAGQLVTVQLRFHEPQPTANDDEPSSWCLMGGKVEEVVDGDEVRVSLEPTSDNAPTSLDGTWTGTLVYDPQRDLPWALTALVKR